MPIERRPVSARVPNPESPRFPYGVDFQKSLIRLILLDPRYGNLALDHLRANYFENEALAWAFQRIHEYRRSYEALPTLQVLFAELRTIPSPASELYAAALESIQHASLADESWLRAKTLDFIQRNMFVTAFHAARELWNEGRTSAVYELMFRAVDRINALEWQEVDREFFFDEAVQRFSRRLSEDPSLDTIATGIHQLDSILGGGLSIGELGIWLAYAKGGKSTMLVNLGVQAVRRGNANVLHLVLEGSRRQAAARYDACFANHNYRQIRQGRLTDEEMRAIEYDYRMLRQRLVIRGLTERFDYNVIDVQNELRDLKRSHNWVPQMIIVDYGDLLRGREHQGGETDNQRAAYRDLKILANRGHAVWTASQARRPPGDDSDQNPERVLRSREVADCFDKVRVADFIGSLNATAQERREHQMRLYAELYRDNGADLIIPVKTDFTSMRISNSEALALPAASLAVRTPRQRRAPI